MYEELEDPEDAQTLLSATAVLKLNGGLGTSMGLEKAKSLLPVKDGKTFLDLIAEQVRLAVACMAGPVRTMCGRIPKTEPLSDPSSVLEGQEDAGVIR